MAPVWDLYLNLVKSPFGQTLRRSMFDKYGDRPTSGLTDTLIPFRVEALLTAGSSDFPIEKDDLFPAVTEYAQCATQGWYNMVSYACLKPRADFIMSGSNALLVDDFRQVWETPEQHLKTASQFGYGDIERTNREFGLCELSISTSEDGEKMDNANEFHGPIDDQPNSNAPVVYTLPKKHLKVRYPLHHVL